MQGDAEVGVALPLPWPSRRPEEDGIVVDRGGLECFPDVVAGRSGPGQGRGAGPGGGRAGGGVQQSVGHLTQ